MYFYEIAVEKKVIRLQGALTYSSEAKLDIGTIVRVSIGKNFANGVVYRQVKKPEFKTKPVDEILDIGTVPAPLIRTASWISSYYQSDTPQIANLLLPRGAQKNRRKTEQKTAEHKQVTSSKLTEDQKTALKKLENTKGTTILHGVTGSGKTRIYIERAKKIVQSGKGVIILVPEIGLTSQLVNEFRQTFDQVFVLHSHLSESERHKTWIEISKTKKPIVIGARSALFAPVHNLGLIVIDEEHETSYKQDKTPRYHAVRVASKLAAEHNAQLILGSATPSVESYYLAKDRGAQIVEMNKTVIKNASADVTVVDLKNRQNFTPKSRLLSKKLITSIEEALKKNEQIMLFHNRRGSSTSVVCTSCGWLAECPSCYLPLTHHHDSHQLICHVCNYKTNTPISCPECKEAALLYKGFGTKQIVAEVSKLFPKASVARFDGDTKNDESLENRYDEIRSGKVDIIVGTQMVAKGLDLPKLNVVGVVLADMSLYLPDYSANERTFQLLYQVAGRVGRHSSDSKVIVQTYSPDHPAIEAAIGKNYLEFYKNEIEQRKLAKYPPFTFLLSLTVERSKPTTAIRSASDFVNVINKDFKDVEVLGPTPAFRERTPNGYRWQLVIKSKNRKNLNHIIEALPDKWQFDIDPANLL